MFESCISNSYRQDENHRHCSPSIELKVTAIGDLTTRSRGFRGARGPGGARTIAAKNRESDSCSGRRSTDTRDPQALIVGDQHVGHGQRHCERNLLPHFK